MIQLQFLNKVLDTQDYSLIKANNFDSSYFSDFSFEFDYIKEHYETYNNVPDKYTFVEKFPSFDIIQVNESDKYLVDELIKDKNTRIMASTFNRLREKINSNDIDGATQLFMHAPDLLVSGRVIEADDIMHDMDGYKKFLDRANDYKKFFIPTGIQQLDDLTGGWDREEDLVAIVARAGIGKSWLLLKCASSAYEKGYTVGLYSGEMSKYLVGYRATTLMTHIPNSSLLHGDQSVEVAYKKFLDKVNADNDKHFWVLTPDKLGGFATVSDLEMFIDKYHLDILCVDQYSLMEDEHNARTPHEKIANISKDLKRLQVTKRIPIICASQQNREKNEEDSSPNTTQISGSDRIGQDASIVIFIESNEDITTYTIGKARNCPKGKKLKFSTDLNLGIFEYIPTEQDALNGASCSDLKKEFETPTGENVF